MKWKEKTRWRFAAAPEAGWRRPSLPLIFAVAAVLITVHALWAAWGSGSEFSRIEMAPGPGNGAAVEGAELNLSPELSPALIEIKVKWVGRKSPRYRYELKAPSGAVVASYSGNESGSEDERRTTHTQYIRVARLPRVEAGRYRLRASLEPDAGEQLLSAQICVRRNVTESHFFRNLGGLVLLYWVIAKWRRRHDEDASASLPPVLEPKNGAPSGPNPPAVGGGWRERLVLEGLALGVSLARTPLVGFYTAWIVIAYGAGLGGEASSRFEATKAVIRPLLKSGIVSWLVPNGEFHGWQAAWVLGCAGGAVVFIVYLATLPVRLFLPPRPRLKFRARAKRLFAIHVAMVVVAALWWWGQPIPSNTTYEEMVIGFGFLNLTLLYVPALVLAQITALLETTLDRFDPRTEV